LEKAVVDVCSKVTSLARGGANPDDFNILVAALWGNVLYLVQYGKGGSFLVREGEVKPIASASEGNFSVASGVVKDDDVIILASESFLNSFSAQDLVGTVGSISPYNLDKRSSCILLKFEVREAFGEEEKIDFGLDAPAGTHRKSAPVKRRSSGLIGKPLASKGKIEMKLRSPRKVQVKRPYILIAVIAALILAGSIYLTLNRNEDTESLDAESYVESAVSEGEGMDEDYIKQYKIVKVSPEVFYDIKIEDSNASPDFMVVLDNHIVAADSSAGSIYVSNASTPSFSMGETAFPNIGYLTYFGGDVAFRDEEGYKVLDIVDNEVVETYLEEGMGITSNYLDFIYSIDRDTIIKYEKLASTLDSSVWGQSSEFEKAVSMAIDGTIYILTKDGGLFGYLTGERSDFEVKGLDKPLSSPQQVVTDFGLDNIYIADTGNSRVVVLDKDGNLVKQLIAEGDELNDMKSIGVTRDEASLFVLSGSRIYRVEL
jgi:hypothetical protein